MPITIDEIRSQIEIIRNGQIQMHDRDLIHEKLTHAYTMHVLKTLNDLILADTFSLVSHLETFLAENWALIQGTALCYTATHDTPITHLLCDVAEFVVNIKSGQMINVLMPTVATDSLYPAIYPNLDPTTAAEIKIILKTHIIGQNGQYLIPVTCITNYDDLVGFKPIDNPYYDVFEHSDSMAYLTEEEIQRLVQHSGLTESIDTAKKSLEIHSNDQNNLLGHLRTLCTQLEYNSVNGVGTELLAGAGASLPIFNFMSYYDHLDGEETARIPQTIRSEITAIKEFVSDQHKLGSIASCQVIRRQAIKSAMLGNEELLSSIGLKGAAKAASIAEAKKQLKESREELSKQVSDHQYTGRDKLGITLDLIHHFNFFISFQSFQDLDLLKELTAEEIEAFCSHSLYKTSIIKAIQSLENLVILSIQLTPKKLKKFLQSLDPQLTQNYFSHGENFFITTLSLDQERRAIYYQQFKDKLPLLIKTANDMKVFSVITSEQGSILYNEIKPRLSSILTSLWDLPMALGSLNPEQRLEAFIVFKETVLGKNLDTFPLPKAQLRRVYEKLQNQLDRMPEDDYNFLILYAFEMAKAYVHPATQCSPLKSKSAFFISMGIPFAGYGFALAAGLIAIAFAIRSIYDLIKGNYNKSLDNLKTSAYFLVSTPLLTLIGTAVAIITIPSFLVRSAVTAGAYVLPGKQASTTNENNISTAPSC